MNSTSPKGGVPPTKNESPSPWIQGVLLGIFIGLAFIGGWMLAKNGGGKNETDTSSKFAASEVSRPTPKPIPTPVIEVSASTEPPPVVEPAKPVSTTPVVEVPEVPANPDMPAIMEPLKPIAPPPPPEPAKLSIMTEPEAKVLLLHDTDVRFLGNADKAGRLVVSEKMSGLSESVSLLFQHPSCVVERRENIELKAGQNLDIVVPLKYLPGSLTIVANTSTAELFLNGASIGKGFVMIGEVASKVPHTIEVRAPNAEPVKRTVVVSPNSTTIERVSITPTVENTGDLILMGTASTLAAQADVVVTLDGKTVQIDQGLIRNVLPGDHTLAIATVPASDKETPRVLWERQVKIEAGTATSLMDDPKVTPRPSVEPVDGESAYLALTLLDSKNRLIRTTKTEISFNNKLLLPRNDGTWSVPLGVSGTLRVSAPGYLTDERQLHFTDPGSYVITCVLHPGQSTTAPATPVKAAPAVPTEWTVRVLAVSAEDGLLVISSSPGKSLIKGDRIRLIPSDISVPIKLSVIDTSQGMVVCQILPGKPTPILPEPSTEATVTNESPL